MHPGELIVVRLKGGPAIGRYVASSDTDGGAHTGRVRVGIGRNREARLPRDRVMMWTGCVPTGDGEAEKLRDNAESLASGIDLRDVWDLAREEPGPVSIGDLSELYWGTAHDLAQRVAVVFHIAREPLYFEDTAEGYLARSEEAVRETLERREREARNAAEANALVEGLASGSLPSPLSAHQRALVGHVRGMVVHGDSYTRSAAAAALVKRVDPGVRDAQRLGFDLLVGAGLMSPDEPLELERAGIPDRFPEEALAEARNIRAEAALDRPGRGDLRYLQTITIDEKDTADRDDALSLEEQADGTCRVWVHIADAGTLIPAGGAVDVEADRRMSSLYLPELKVPMVPPEVSEDAGSLTAGVPRAALSVSARLSESGEVLDWDVAPSVIESRAALSYEEADRALEDPGHAWHGLVSGLAALGDILRLKRDMAGAVTIDRPELAVDIGPSGEVDVRVVTRTAARRTVAEMMILCNGLLAELCRRESLPAAYRSQPAPEPGDPAPGLEDGPMSWYLAMRRLPPAELSTTPGPHGSLGVPVYLQATSPLRRYPDLVVQRQVSGFLATGSALYSEEQVASAAQRAHVQLREIASIEESRRRYWFLKYLRQRLDEPNGQGEALYEAVVLDRRPRRPALLELSRYPFRFRAELPDSVAPGERVVMRLHGVDLWQRTAQLTHVPQP